MKGPNGWREGVKKLSEHLLGFGAPFGLLAVYGGWGTAVTLVAWRAWAEYGDWRSGSDTPAKAVIDFISQVAITVLVAVLKIRGIV